MYKQDIYFQDIRRDPTSETLDAICAAVGSSKLLRLSAAVAYASGAGSKLLDQALTARTDSWPHCHKRWLISIDFGRTEPAAIDYLSKIPLSEVRIHDGKYVIKQKRFNPRCVFHPKIYFGHDNKTSNQFFGSFIGSGNLTGSGLRAGTECGTLMRWDSPISPGEIKVLTAAKTQLAWYDAIWKRADPANTIIKDYAKLRPKNGFPGDEEEAESVKWLNQVSANSISEIDLLRYHSAKSIWTTPHKLTKNRGKNLPGNQVFFPRGAQVFFGFSAADVPENTEHGKIVLQIAKGGKYERTVSFSDNHMIKVILPVPEEMGLGTFDDRVLLFTRAGQYSGKTTFLFSALTTKEFAEVRAAGLSEVERKLKGSSRAVGWLF